jgi:hypothetical protein
MIKYKNAEKPETQERRRHRRCAIFWPGQITCRGCSINFDLLDISAGGARIHLSAPLIDTSAVTIRIDRIGEFRAEVVWRGLDDAGLRFLDDDETPPCMKAGSACPPCGALDAALEALETAPCLPSDHPLDRSPGGRPPAGERSRLEHGAIRRVRVWPHVVL